ncbi:DMT family transporter [Desulfolutivibrio sulfoxidireducens]|uniref:DMT family transporter n=1 Tax=Desulfolutivibrio sulfoxidireducens TaxID=2773299 RepID=UPI00159CF855|nr:DMT family transporter [Desulfolutivibrio sulfoxidireducens]QLA19463.1 EamA family transporter [Desulfolutivibrio sulfoxidireducens]
MVRGAALVVGSAICYGMGPIIFKSGLAAGLAPFDLLMCRFCLAAILLTAFLLIRGRGRIAIPRRTMLRAVVAAPVFNCSQTFLFVTALKYIPASTNSLILYVYPLAVAVLSRLFFGFQAGREFVISLLLVLAGSVFVSFDAFFQAAPLPGIAASVGAMLVFSANLIVLQRFLRTEDPMAFTLCVFVVAGAIFAAVRGPAAVLSYTPEQVVWAALAGIVPTALAVPLLYAGVARIGSAYASIFSSLELVVTVALSGLVLGEAVSWRQAAGMGCIIGGLVLPNLALLRTYRAVHGPRGSKKAASDDMGPDRER